MQEVSARKKVVKSYTLARITRYMEMQRRKLSWIHVTVYSLITVHLLGSSIVVPALVTWNIYIRDV